MIDLPYEFDSNSRDTPIILRRGYERPIPDWNRRFESRFQRDGITVKVTDCSFGSRLKASAFEEVIVKGSSAFWTAPKEMMVMSTRSHRWHPI